ncbi:MAG: hypothetical protein ACLQHF_08010 [Terracidiphilus sp.]
MLYQLSYELVQGRFLKVTTGASAKNRRSTAVSVAGDSSPVSQVHDPDPHLAAPHPISGVVQALLPFKMIFFKPRPLVDQYIQ